MISVRNQSQLGVIMVLILLRMIRVTPSKHTVKRWCSMSALKQRASMNALSKLSQIWIVDSTLLLKVLFDSRNYNFNFRIVHKFFIMVPGTTAKRPFHSFHAKFLFRSWWDNLTFFAAAPYWPAGPPPNKRTSEGEDVTFDCSANGKPTPVITFYKNGVGEWLIVELICFSVVLNGGFPLNYL